MLFNSIEFILYFIFPVFCIVFTISRYSEKMAIAIIIVSSLFFYSQWYEPYVFLLLFSIVINYFICSNFKRMRKSKVSLLLYFGIIINLGILCFFKYSIFIAENIALLNSVDIDHEVWFLKIVLPLGISFYSFQQISFLIDTYKNKIKLPSFSRYLLYVTFFPQLIAGPIVRWHEFNNQINLPFKNRINLEFFASGIFLFIIGLSKKTLLADPIAFYFCDPIFLSAERGENISFFSAWVGTLAFTFQIYFDFSGYSDMALGLAYIFGIRLPKNFDAPYKATSIIEFWRKWHITLSTFLRDYLYFPLGGNKNGLWNQSLAIGITMILGGLWHGASWTFVMWGILHGVFIILNHFFRSFNLIRKESFK